MLPSDGASKYSVGARIYRGTSLAPHLGTKNPTGYITRGVTQSRKRSGLAATALRMIQRPGGSFLAGRTPDTPNSPLHQISTRTPQSPGAGFPAGKFPNQHPPTFPTPSVPVIHTSPTGRITAVPIPASDPTQAQPTSTDPNFPGNVLPFDEGTALQRDALSKGHSDALDNLNRLRQQLNESSVGQQHTLDEQRPQLALNLLNRYAGRGLAYSSGYGMGVGQQNQALAAQQAAIQQQLQEGLANYASQQQQADDAYNQGLAQLNYESAQNLASKAGQLGLGQTDTPPATTPAGTITAPTGNFPAGKFPNPHPPTFPTHSVPPPRPASRLHLTAQQIRTATAKRKAAQQAAQRKAKQAGRKV